MLTNEDCDVAFRSDEELLVIANKLATMEEELAEFTRDFLAPRETRVSTLLAGLAKRRDEPFTSNN